MQKLLSVVLVLFMPAACYLYPFACGFLNLSQAAIMFLLPMMLFGPLVVTAIVGRFRRTGPWWRHLAICIGLYASVVIVFFVGPPGAIKETIGFAYNLRLTKDPVQIQQWATDILAGYDKGKIERKPKAEYWAAGRELLSERDIPKHIRNLWWHIPSIGIATMADGYLLDPSQTNTSAFTSLGELSNRVHCVAFSWYLRGALVGPPGFKPAWNPWYTHQVIPGVYAYSGMK